MEKDIFTIEENTLSYGRGYVYSLQYHLIWCTKYRKKNVLVVWIRYVECEKIAAGAGGGIPFSDSGHGGYAGSHSFAGELVSRSFLFPDMTRDYERKSGKEAVSFPSGIKRSSCGAVIYGTPPTVR